MEQSDIVQLIYLKLSNLVHFYLMTLKQVIIINLDYLYRTLSNESAFRRTTYNFACSRPDICVKAG